MPTCLIIEDNPLNQAVAQQLAIKLGYKPMIFGNGQSALDYCKRAEMPDLILLDGYMPVMNGLEFLEELHKLPNADHPFIIFCSSSMDQGDVDIALQIGAHCHIPKPLDLDDLAAAINSKKVAS